jgi:tetratricopeptide (TPR) repeat protein
MNDDFQWGDDYQIDMLADRFEKMVSSGGLEYFDSEEFEALIDFYQNNFDNDRSRLALEMALQQHPSSLGLRVKFARQLASEGSLKTALMLLEDIEKSEPNEAEIVMTKGSVYSLMNEPEKAIVELKKAVPMVDEDELEEIFTSIAFEYEKIDKFDHALVYLKKALFQTPDSESLMYEIGMCFSMGQRLEEAVEFFQNQTNQNPYSIPAWYNLGLSYFQLELYEKSIDAFEFVLSIDDRYTQAYQSMAHAYASIENFEKAIEVYFESFEFEQPDAMTYYYIGECYEKMKDALNALEYYRKSIEIDPLLADPWAGIGALLDEQGDLEGALKYTLKALALDPSNIELNLITADQLIKSGQYELAETYFQKAEAIDPNDEDVYIEYANLCVLQKDHVKAIEILRKGIIQQPENYVLYYRLGATLLFVNHIAEALFYLDLALKHDYEGHTELLEYYPEMFKLPEVAELFEENRPVRK